MYVVACPLAATVSLADPTMFPGRLMAPAGGYTVNVFAPKFMITFSDPNGVFASSRTPVPAATVVNTLYSPAGLTFRLYAVEAFVPVAVNPYCDFC